MVGQGVLRECLLDSAVREVLIIGRTASGMQHPKLREIVHHDFLDFSGLEGELAGLDACFFCLGVSSAGMSQEDYACITYGFTMAAAQTLSRVNPGMTFVYVSGEGTDSSENGRTMWARVKGKTENALLRQYLHAFMFRPGLIQPLDGIRSKTPAYRLFYAILKPVLPLLRWAFPNQVLSTRDIGQAMLTVAKRGSPQRILESKDIRAAVSS